MKLDWAYSFERTIQRLEADVFSARIAGAQSYQFGNQGKRLTNLQDLTREECSAACREHATKVLNMAIIIHENR